MMPGQPILEEAAGMANPKREVICMYKDDCVELIKTFIRENPEVLQVLKDKL